MFSVSTYYCWEMFISFDTSALGNSATITAAELSLYLFTNDTGGSSFTAQARLLDWGASLTTADWVAGGSISQTLLGTISTSSIGTGYFSFTENSTLFRDNIVKTGTTRMFCVSSRHVGNNTPTGRERLQVYDSGAAGTSQDPKLTITYTLPAGPSIRRAPLRIWRRAA